MRAWCAGSDVFTRVRLRRFFGLRNGSPPRRGECRDFQRNDLLHRMEITMAKKTAKNKSKKKVHQVCIEQEHSGALAILSISPCAATS